MVSRLERYHKKNNTATKKRSERNKEIYDRLYEDAEYTNIEDISRIEKTNEVDIAKIREMLNRQVKSTKQTTEEEQTEKEEKAEETQTGEYDVKKFLDEAKKNRSDEDERKRSLDSSYYNTIKKEETKKKEKEDSEKLKELIHTITSTKVLEDLNNKELSEKLLDELHDDSADEEKDETTKEISERVQDNSKKQMTKDSFYTNSLNFKNQDFEDLNEAVAQGSKTITILLVFLFLAMVALIAYIVLNVI